MKIVRDLDEFDASRGSAVSVGVFDGFHLGHARIVETLRAEASRLAAPACALTFTTHPRKLLSGDAQPLVTSVEHRLLLLRRAGVDVALAVDFTRELASLPAEEFVREVLGAKLGARALVLGTDARMGRGGGTFDKLSAAVLSESKGGGADAPRIREIASARGIEATLVPPVVVEGAPVSSTRVREAIAAGELELAARLLGRRVSVLGRVVPGRGRGRALGFPTANLDLEHEVRPPHGVYATWAYIDPCGPGPGGRLASVTNSGFRPTFVETGEPEGAPERLVEVHLLEPPAPARAAAEGDELYGRTVEVEFVRKLRDERRFASDWALSEQIARDVGSAREILASG